MSRVTANTFIGGGLNDAVYCAPKATTLPTTLAAPDAAFVEVGWISEDGMEGNANVDRAEFRAHQGGTIIRRKVTGSGRTWTFTALEMNLTTMKLAHPGISWTKSGSIVTGVIPENIQTQEFAWIIDSYDSTQGTQIRYMFTGEASLAGAYTFSVDNMTAYQFELASYGAPIIITNQAGLVAAVS